MKCVNDHILLHKFHKNADQEAFEMLLDRHGKMVLNAAYSVLRDTNTAEDVLQATFLTLASKAKSIDPKKPLASWLYFVAVCIARDERRKEKRRKTREQEAAMISSAYSTSHAATESDIALIYEEISNLPENDRAPLVLHHLEGKSYEDSAAEIGCTVHAFGMRLTRAREKLRNRLAGRGVILGLAAIVASLGESATAAEVPASALASTIKAATLIAGGKVAAGSIASASVASMTKGAIKMLFWMKVKLVTAFCAAVVVVGMPLSLGISAALSADDKVKDNTQVTEVEKKSKKEIAYRFTKGQVFWYESIMDWKFSPESDVTAMPDEFLMPKKMKEVLLWRGEVISTSPVTIRLLPIWCWRKADNYITSSVGVGEVLITWDKDTSSFSNITRSSDRTGADYGAFVNGVGLPDFLYPLPNKNGKSAEDESLKIITVNAPSSKLDFPEYKHDIAINLAKKELLFANQKMFGADVKIAVDTKAIGSGKATTTWNSKKDLPEHVESEFNCKLVLNTRLKEQENVLATMRGTLSATRVSTLVIINAPKGNSINFQEIIREYAKERKGFWKEKIKENKDVANIVMKSLENPPNVKITVKKSKDDDNVEF